MFDIGFWEILVIAVVALLVVGPDEFPGLIRNVSAGIGKIRRFVSAVKSDLEHEIEKADELKELIAKETKIAEAHSLLDEVNGPVAVPRSTRSQTESKQTNEAADKGTSEEVAKPHASGPRHGSD